ncbi:MAG TPA: energy-coupling factor transporter transmembrane protein EcfT [Thermofilum sp.]|nr:energy-coupling factor transporter transmembrane protein EcfT [Thermofilum sp.]
MSVLEGFLYKPKESPLHRLDPRSKAIILLFYTVTSLIYLDPLILCVLLLSIFLLSIVGKCVKEWGKSVKATATFALVIFILNILTSPGQGYVYAIAMSLRFLSLAAAFSLYFLTTPPEALALTLEAAGLPRDFTLMLTLSLRFVPTLARDLQIVTDAFRSRGLKLDSGSYMERLYNFAKLLTPLIVFEIRRSLMIAEALESRGFGGAAKPTLYKPPRMSFADYIIMIGGLAALGAIVFLRFLGFPQ